MATGASARLELGIPAGNMNNDYLVWVQLMMIVGGAAGALLMRDRAWKGGLAVLVGLLAYSLLARFAPTAAKAAQHAAAVVVMMIMGGALQMRRLGLVSAVSCAYDVLIALWLFAPEDWLAGMIDA